MVAPLRFNVCVCEPELMSIVPLPAKLPVTVTTLAAAASNANVEELISNVAPIVIAAAGNVFIPPPEVARW